MDFPEGIKPTARADGDSLLVTFVNHSTFLIQTKGLNILTDPVWAERASPVGFAGPKRMRSAGIRFEDLPKIDLILLTHNHYDHLDIATMQRLWEDHRPIVYCPLGVGAYLKRKGIENVIEMDWLDRVTYNPEVDILCTPAQHFPGRGMFDRDRTLWSGFALMMEQGIPAGEFLALEEGIAWKGMPSPV
jgi:L-ascorbate metabolism protein UlaG (beta-lactamase superfamily)